MYFYLLTVNHRMQFDPEGEDGGDLSLPTRDSEEFRFVCVMLRIINVDHLTIV